MNKKDNEDFTSSTCDNTYFDGDVNVRDHYQTNV